MALIIIDDKQIVVWLAVTYTFVWLKQISFNVLLFVLFKSGSTQDK